MLVFCCLLNPITITNNREKTMSIAHLKQINKIIKTKAKVDASSLYSISKENLEKESRVELQIKEILAQSDLCQKERNAFKKTLTKTYFNHALKIPPPEGYVCLRDYVQLKSKEGLIIRASEIKKLLILLDYMVKNYPTNKSYRNKVVHTEFITYQLIGLNRSKEVLKLWKITFLDRILKQSNDKFQICRNSFSYRRPRSDSESTNCIRNGLSILMIENKNIQIDTSLKLYEISLILKYLKPQDLRTINLIKYITLHIRFRIKNYNTKL
jgi:hypothetical protein